MPPSKSAKKASQKGKGKENGNGNGNGKSQTPQKQKEKIPLEIKNAREWDPNRKREEESESSQFETDEEYDEDWPQGPYVSGGLQVINNGLESSKPLTNQQTGHVTEGKPQYTNSRRSTQPRRPKRVFNYEADNFGRAAYRKKLPHTGKFVLHKDCHEIEPSRAKLYDMFLELGVRLGSFIRPPQHVKDRELLIWGNAAQVNATITELQAWLSPNRAELIGRKSTARDKFANEYSNIGTKYKTIQSKILKEASIQKFQQIPEVGKSYPFNGSFIWPVDELRPEEILGSNSEAFDSIRFQQQCHIVFDNKEECFKVMADDEKSVEKALLRIEGTVKEYVAKSSRRIIEHLIEAPSTSAIRKDIKIVLGPSSGTTAEYRKVPTLTGGALDSVEHLTWAKRAAEITLDSQRRTEQALLRCIPNLTCYRGQIQMRILFGTFTLTLYKGNGESLPFEDWLKNLQKPGTRGDLIKDLFNNEDAATVMDNLYKADHIFQPLNNSIYSLEEVAPSFSARFVFQNVDQPAIQLDVELNTSGLDEKLYEKTHALWSRVDRRDNAVPLSIYMVRLDRQASWKLQASTENTIDLTRIQPKMTDFTNSVKLRKLPKSKVALTGEKIFQWERELPGTMRPITFEQKTSFRYRLVHDVEWIFEVSRYDVYGDAQDENVPTKTCWGASMWNTEWDSTLASNAGLGIGEAATWEPNLGTFFPSPSKKAPDTQEIDPGVLSFLKSVKIITEFLDGIERGPLRSDTC